MLYDCIIVGGGIAGLQGAIQLGRYQHQTLVIDAQDGRSTLCRSYHNILGWPDGVSGKELRERGKTQAEKLGVQFTQGEVKKAKKPKKVFAYILMKATSLMESDCCWQQELGIAYRMSFTLYFLVSE